MRVEVTRRRVGGLQRIGHGTIVQTQFGDEAIDLVQRLPGAARRRAVQQIGLGEVVAAVLQAHARRPAPPACRAGTAPRRPARSAPPVPRDSRCASSAWNSSANAPSSAFCGGSGKLAPRIFWSAVAASWVSGARRSSSASRRCAPSRRLPVEVAQTVAQTLRGEREIRHRQRLDPGAKRARSARKRAGRGRMTRRQAGWPVGGRLHSCRNYRGCDPLPAGARRRARRGAPATLAPWLPSSSPRPRATMRPFACSQDRRSAARRARRWSRAMASSC